MEAIETVPKTALDVFRMLPEGTLCEVIDNILYMSPAPIFRHQKLLGFLFKKISDHVDSQNLGEVIFSPFDVYFEELLSAVQPDLLFVSNQNMGILKKDGRIHGTPDLIIEVLSGDKQRDKVMKKSLYERAGVKEYFIINPENKRIQAYILKNGLFELSYEDEGKFRSALLNLSFEF